MCSDVSMQTKVKPEINSFYRVQDSASVVRKAIVLSTRCRSDSGAEQYFVHFENCDRRLDEWVSLDRFQETTDRHLETAVTVRRSPPGMRTRYASQRRRSTVPAPATVTLSHDSEDLVLASKTDAGDNSFTDNLVDPDDLVEQEFNEMTKVKYIDYIHYGKYKINCWYFSPYPESYRYSLKLYICRFCLAYLRRRSNYLKHMERCQICQPPGVEIYNQGTVSVFAVDSVTSKLFCQHLCLMAKLFLDHKTIYYDVEPFSFFVVTMDDEDNPDAKQVIGYYSKERECFENYNVSCILVLPPFQRNGIGKFIISFSYEISKREGFLGSPERPLSDLGIRSYNSYWKWKILEAIKHVPHGTILQIAEIAQDTNLATADVYDMLSQMNMVKYFERKNVAFVDSRVVEDELREARKPKLLVVAGRLTWPLTPDSES